MQKDIHDVFRIYEISRYNKEFNRVFYYNYYIYVKWRYIVIYEDKGLEVFMNSLRMFINSYLPLKIKVKFIGASLLNLAFHNFVRNYVLKTRIRNVRNIAKIAEWAIDH